MSQTDETSMPPIKVNDNIIVDDKAKAEAFNLFFAKAALVSDESANLPEFHPVTDQILDNIVVSEQDVYDQLSSVDISKSYGSDEISPRFLKEGRDFLFKPLCKLFNLSLQLSVFPSLWKGPILSQFTKRTVETFVRIIDQCLC